MLNMYSDHYRLIANHVDGARGRRFRMRSKPKAQKTSKSCEPMGPKEILHGLEYPS